ncbi:MAG: hypothetical protein AUK35_05115 [Zetaproteobacteria bacterium CG2_30_46_52]|nr:MAG: hypothetical protein AUK35_05115 [Zetaproteobacteria bacterium CG2_30_46_52]
MKNVCWKLETDAQNIGWLHLDVPGKSANTLSQATIEELSTQLDEAIHANLKGLVMISDKSSGFIAGAEVSEFTQIQDVEEAENFMANAREVFAKLENMQIPTLALIHGHCLGGGLELALACDYRVAEEGASLGFPEVNLGIFPGFGGSVRAIQKMGVRNAMPLMLSGRPMVAKLARKAGLVDVVVPQRQLKRAAVHTILNQPTPVHKRKTTLVDKALNSNLGRSLLSKYLRKQTKAIVNEAFYPAPFALIDVWQRFGNNREIMFVQEGKAVSALIASPTAQNLVRLFFLQDKLKAMGKVETTPIQHVHVIGAGVMGGDIAGWCALQGFKVTLQDQNMQVVASAIARSATLYGKILKRDPRAQQAAMDRLIPDLAGDGVAQADLIVEAIVENLDIKQGLYKSLEPRMKKDAILATNTSGIPIDELALVLKKPERLLGMHFFNPVSKMKLVEIVAGEKTDTASLERAFAFVTKIRRLPLPVKSAPGFLVNRILMPYLMEAIRMVVEGISPQAIDKAALDFGMPMGPVTLADKVGLDVCLAVAKDLEKISDDVVPEFLQTWVSEGRLGMKSGQGFYTYNKGKAQGALSTSSEHGDIQHRLIMRMLNEAVRCLDEGIVADSELLDAGMVFGTGFAPFRGGVMAYIEQTGKKEIMATLKAMEKTYGPRFKGSAAAWKKV